jgi:hypothetical protein
MSMFSSIFTSNYKRLCPYAKRSEFIFLNFHEYSDVENSLI